MISDQTYKELEEIVGATNASREPAVLDGYSWQTHMCSEPEIWYPRAEAVVLPESTEEVQAVVRLCNKHKMKVKAFSTGWGGFAAPGVDNVILVDLRRMNRIIEIDQKNMIAVVEPYVIAGVLQAEAMKVGLNSHIIGAGPSHSPLAAATSVLGTGWDGIYMSNSFRNLVGAEWVLPSGEVLRFGSLGSGSGWFSADGPGPSLRGVMRGYMGAMGGMGIFTKCALKLYNWPGDAKPKIDGALFDVESEIPSNFGNYICIFKSQEKYADAVYKIGEAEIGYNHAKVAIPLLIANAMPRLLRRLGKHEGIARIMHMLRYQCFLMLAGSSQSEFDYQKKVLEKIVEEHEGILFDFSSIPAAEQMIWFGFLRSTLTPLVFRATGNYMAHYGGDECLDSSLEIDEKMRPFNDKWKANGAFLDQMGDDVWAPSYENVNRTHHENIRLFDHRTHQVEMLGNTAEYFLSGLENFMSPGMSVIDPLARTIFSPLACNYNEYQKKILASLDENGVSDTRYYTDVAG